MADTQEAADQMKKYVEAQHQGNLQDAKDAGQRVSPGRENIGNSLSDQRKKEELRKSMDSIKNRG